MKSFVEGWVGEINIFLVHAFLCQGNRFAEALEVDDFPLPQEADDVVYVWVIGQAENIVIGKAGLLLWCDLVRTTFFVGGIGFL